VPLRDWRQGSQWFEMARAVARLVVADRVFYPAFRAHCSGPNNHCFPDEQYLPTMLSILAPQRLANRTLTWTHWKPGKVHPSTLQDDFFSEASVTNNFLNDRSCTWNGAPNAPCHLFARKVAPEALSKVLSVTHMFGY